MLVSHGHSLLFELKFNRLSLLLAAEVVHPLALMIRRAYLWLGGGSDVLINEEFISLPLIINFQLWSWRFWLRWVIDPFLKALTVMNRTFRLHYLRLSHSNWFIVNWFLVVDWPHERLFLWFVWLYPRLLVPSNLMITLAASWRRPWVSIGVNGWYLFLLGDFDVASTLCVGSPCDNRFRLILSVILEIVIWFDKHRFIAFVNCYLFLFWDFGGVHVACWLFLLRSPRFLLALQTLVASIGLQGMRLDQGVAASSSARFLHMLLHQYGFGCNQRCLFSMVLKLLSQEGFLGVHAYFSKWVVAPLWSIVLVQLI